MTGEINPIKNPSEINQIFSALTAKWQDRNLVLIKDKKRGKWQTVEARGRLHRTLIKLEALASPNKIVVRAEKRAAKELYHGSQKLAATYVERVTASRGDQGQITPEAVAKAAFNSPEFLEACESLKAIAYPTDDGSELGKKVAAFGQMRLSKLGIKGEQEATLREILSQSISDISDLHQSTAEALDARVHQLQEKMERSTERYLSYVDAGIELVKLQLAAKGDSALEAVTSGGLDKETAVALAGKRSDLELKLGRDPQAAKQLEDFDAAAQKRKEGTQAHLQQLITDLPTVGRRSTEQILENLQKAAADLPEFERKVRQAKEIKTRVLSLKDWVTNKGLDASNLQELYKLESLVSQDLRQIQKTLRKIKEETPGKLEELRARRAIVQQGLEERTAAYQAAYGEVNKKKPQVLNAIRAASALVATISSLPKEALPKETTDLAKLLQLLALPSDPKSAVNTYREIDRLAKRLKIEGTLRKDTFLTNASLASKVKEAAKSLTFFGTLHSAFVTVERARQEQLEAEKKVAKADRSVQRSKQTNESLVRQSSDARRLGREAEAALILVSQSL